MTINDVLKGATWVCQWRCPFMGEVNRTRKQELPQGIESPHDLPPHLICHGCKMGLGEMPLIQFMVHQTCPATIPQRKKFTIHVWPDDKASLSQN
jgi:hypothetical protein